MTKGSKAAACCRLRLSAERNPLDHSACRQSGVEPMPLATQTPRDCHIVASSVLHA